MLHPDILQSLQPITDEEQAILDGKALDKSVYMNPASSVIQSRKLLSQGKLITVRPHTRFVAFPEHTHDYVEVVYMCLGSTTHLVNEKPIVLRQGELLFLCPGARQEIRTAGKNDIAVNFIILPEFFDSALVMLGEEDSPLKKFIVDCLCGTGGSSGFLHFKVSSVLPIQNLVENLIWTLIQNTRNKRRINQITMGLLFLQLLNHTECLSYDTPGEEAILCVMRYIEEHYRDGSLTELSQTLHYDFCWLSREIKKKTGKTYTGLVQEKRLTQAAYWLTNTTLPVSAVSHSVGYDNVSYFHSLFKKRFNCSPKRYRDNK